MSTMTYSDLYQLVYKEILKNTSYPSNHLTGKQALDRNQIIAGMSTSTSQAMVDIANVLTHIMDLMLHTVPPQIKSGLTVSATTPVSNQVIVEAGEGTVGGKIFILNTDTRIVIPLDDGGTVYYINCGSEGLNISKTPIFGKLTIAKIVVPKPGTTVHIRDNKDLETYPWDAWIVNFKEIKLFGDGQGHFEEDTRQVLRNNIGDILADNLIGNIRLSEDLKIINTQGTLELDSKSIKIFDVGENKLAEFNRYGTFFYDTTGTEVARFATDSARVGNILITKNSIQSQNYASNVRGFRITDTGFAEFEDVHIRGTIKASVFEHTSISAVGGQLIIGNATVLAEDITSLDNTMECEASVFSNGDIVIIKNLGEEEYIKILNDENAPVYAIERGLKDGPRNWEKGITLVSLGGESQGHLILDATSEYSPFLDIITRTGTDWDDTEVKVRLGNLSGITDPELGTLSGYGLYSDNAYLKGELFALAIKTALSGSRIDMDTQRFFAYDNSENLLFQIFLDDVHPSGVDPGHGYGDVGDVYFADYPGHQGLFWDASESKLWIRGFLDATDVTVGRLSVRFLTSGTIGEDSGESISIDMGTESSMRSFQFLDVAPPGPDWGWQLNGDGQIQMILGGQSGVEQSYIQSQDFVIDTSGWRLTADNVSGEGEFQCVLGDSSYIVVNDGGYIQSNNYVFETSGYKLFDDSIEINTGAIDGSIINEGTLLGSSIADDTITTAKLTEQTVIDLQAPTGAVLLFGSVTAPEGWLLCDGSAVSRSEYDNLFDVIGTTFGVGDGSTTFNLPDFTNRFAYGASSGAAPGNAAVGSKGVGTDLLISGTGNNVAANHSHGSHSGVRNDYQQTNPATNSSKNVMPPYLAIYYIIKY
jgi:microcystin-dependent protein